MRFRENAQLYRAHFFLSAYKIYDRNGYGPATLQSLFGYGTCCESKYRYVTYIFTLHTRILYRLYAHTHSSSLNEFKIFRCTVWRQILQSSYTHTHTETHFIGIMHSLFYRKCDRSECKCALRISCVRVFFHCFVEFLIIVCKCAHILYVVDTYKLSTIQLSGISSLSLSLFVRS